MYLTSVVISDHQCVATLTETLCYLINKYAPFRKKLVIISDSHWFNDDTINAKKRFEKKRDII